MPTRKQIGTKRRQPAASGASAQPASHAPEETLRVFIEQSPIAMAMFDREMRYLHASRQWRIDHGLGNGELRGKSHYDLFPGVPGCCKGVHRRGLAGETGSCCGCEGLKQAGRSAPWLNWEARPWHDANGAVAGILICGVDRQAGEELRQQRELFETVVHHMPAAVCLIRGSDLRVKLVNPAYQAIAPGKEMIGKTLAEIWQEAGQDLGALCRRVLETGEAHEVKDERFSIRRSPTAPEEQAHFSWSLHRVFVPGDNDWAILNTALETTKRRLAEEDLCKNEERLRLAQRAAGAGVWEWEMATGNLVCSPELFQLFGVDQAKTNATLDVWRTLLHPKDRVVAEQKLTEAVGNQTALDSEYRIVRSSGEVRWIHTLGRTASDGNGNPQRMYGICLDITARKLAEAALREREAELSRVLEIAATGLARCSHDFRYVWANSSFARLVGIPLEEIVGLPVVEIVGEAAFEMICPYLCRVLGGERVEFELEVPFRHRARYVHAILTPDVNSERQITGWFASITDVTEQKSLEREVLRISEGEQQSLAANLHDGVCQDLIAVSATVKGLQRQLEKQGHPLAEEMGAITSTISQSAARARHIALELSPVVTEGDGLMGALRQLVVRTAQSFPVDCSFECSSPLLSLETVVSSQLFFIAQEAVRNAVRQRGATGIVVELRQSASDIFLEVTDNRCGSSAGDDQTHGLSLRAMQYRAGLIGGQLTVERTGRGGTEIICRIPKPQEKGAKSELSRVC